MVVGRGFAVIEDEVKNGVCLAHAVFLVGIFHRIESDFHRARNGRVIAWFRQRIALQNSALDGRVKRRQPGRLQEFGRLCVLAVGQQRQLVNRLVRAARHVTRNRVRNPRSDASGYTGRVLC